MVGAEGFEPSAFCSRSKRATRLRYAPTRDFELLSRKTLYSILLLPLMSQVGYGIILVNSEQRTVNKFWNGFSAND